MGLGQALTSAVSGLRVTQSGLSLIASNIANAETPGYVKKSATQVAAASGNLTIGVRLSSITRELDQYLQRQLRTEQSGGAYATERSDFFQRLQSVFGQPGESNALESVFNNFTTAVQALSTSPDSSASRYGVLTAGQTLAQHLNGMTADIQGLRSDAELGLSDAVNQANAALRNIAAINQQLGLTNVQDATTATLEGPARLLHRPALAADGHQGGRERPQPGQYLHPRRIAARRRPRRHDRLRCERLAVGGLAMEYRSGQALGRHAAARFRLRHAGRHDRRQHVRLGQDRGADRDARSRAGRRAGADRPDRIRDVARAVGPHDERHRRHVRLAIGLRGRYRRAAVRQHDQSDLYGQPDQHAAHGHAGARR